MTRIDGVAQPITHLLTAIVLCHNRSHDAVRQLRVFEKSNFRHPVIVADSSEVEEAARIREAVPSHIQYVRYAPKTSFYDKLASVTARIETPFVVLIPDRKITFPHTIDVALTHLIDNEDHVAAQGYVVGFHDVRLCFVCRFPQPAKPATTWKRRLAVGIVRPCEYVIHTWRIADKGRFAR